MIKAGIIGATGYAGTEVIRLLNAHPNVKIEAVTSRSYSGLLYNDIFENYRHERPFLCTDESLHALAEKCDVVFVALPHGVLSGMLGSGLELDNEILSKAKIIDLGADFRLKDADIYEKWYEVKHENKPLIKHAVYGLCEINRTEIMKTSLVANPGCYTTCSILSLYPLLKEGVIDTGSIIIDAKSGVTGAGRGVSLGVHFNETNESVKAYKIASHRHTPEIEEQLSYAAGEPVTISFTPHLIPMNRGILATCYANLNGNFNYNDIRDIYNRYYGDEYFIRITKESVFPETKWVKGSNFCDIGFTVDERTNRVIVVGALDNLVKGAAGQAVQNMNILFGLDEKTSLDYVPYFPI